MVKSICCSNKEHRFSDPEIYLPLPDGKQLSLILALGCLTPLTSKDNCTSAGHKDTCLKKKIIFNKTLRE